MTRFGCGKLFKSQLNERLALYLGGEVCSRSCVSIPLSRRTSVLVAEPGARTDTTNTPNDGAHRHSIMHIATVGQCTQPPMCGRRQQGWTHSVWRYRTRRRIAKRPPTDYQALCLTYLHTVGHPRSQEVFIVQAILRNITLRVIKTECGWVVYHDLTVFHCLLFALDAWTRYNLCMNSDIGIRHASMTT